MLGDDRRRNSFFGGRMSFDQYLEQAWNIHGKNPEDVARDLSNGVRLVVNRDQAEKMARLIGHLFTDHVKDFEMGLGWLEQLAHQTQDSINNNSSLVGRQARSFRMAMGHEIDLSELTVSGRVQVLAQAAAAAMAVGNWDKTQAWLRQAALIARDELLSTDPVHRTLAVVANNVAAEIEEMAASDLRRSGFGVESAQIARVHWEKAGTWLETGRSEYRICKSALAQGDVRQAERAAQNYLEICERHKADALEVFFACEAQFEVARAEGQGSAAQSWFERAKTTFQEISETDRLWVQGTMNQIEKNLRVM